MRNFLIIILILFSFLVAAGITDFGSNSLGTNAMAYLKLPVGARTTALGGNAISLAHDASSVYNNPAAMSFFLDNEIFFSHDETFFDFGIRHEYLTGILPTYRYGSFGARLNLMTYGTFSNVREINEVEVNPSALDFAFALMYSKAFIDNSLSVGVALSYFRSSLDIYNANAFATDLSLMYKYNKIFTGVFGLKNIGTSVSYSVEGLDGNADESLPMGVYLDFGTSLLKGKLNFSLGSRKYSDSPLILSSGVEYFLSKSFGLRSGYSYSISDNDDPASLTGFSAGLGIKQKSMVFDYSFSYKGSYLGTGHMFDLGYRFGTISPPTMDDFYKKAVEYFKREKYHKAIEWAQQALKLNPNMWKAMQLIEESLRRLRIQDESLIAIMYTGNINGNFTSNSTKGLGGLDRVSGLVMNYKNTYPYNIVLECGNLISENTDAYKKEIAYPIIEKIGYDVVNIGSEDYITNPANLIKSAKENSIKLLSSNILFSSGNKEVKTYFKKKLAGKFQVGVAGLLGPKVPKFSYASPLNGEVALQKLLDNELLATDIKILMLSEDIAGCRYYANRFPELDVIISSNNNLPVFSPIMVGKTMILSPGRKGEYFGFISLEYNSNKKLIRYNNKIIPLNGKAPSDPRITAVLNKMVDDAHIPDDSNAVSPAKEIVPFVSAYDMTAYHSNIQEQLQGLIENFESLGVFIDKHSLDSMKRRMVEAEKFEIKKQIEEGSIWGIASKDDTTKQIFVWKAGTEKVQRVSWNKRNNHTPKMNMQGSSLFYLSDTTKGYITFIDSIDMRYNTSELVIYDLRTRLSYKIKPKGKKGSILEACWDYDGNSVYYTELDSNGFSDLFYYDFIHNRQVNISHTKNANEFSVSASPRGENIAWTSNMQGGRQIFLSGRDGTKYVRTTFDKGYCSNLNWSPDGNKLAYLYHETEKSGNYGDLRILDATNSKVSKITRNLKVRDLVWKNANTLFISSGINFTDINSFNLKTNKITKVTGRRGFRYFSETTPVIVNDSRNRELLLFEERYENKTFVKMFILNSLIPEEIGRSMPAFNPKWDIRLR